MLTLSIVIPVRNGERTLPACFAALDQLNPAPAEIIFVDNGSTDGTSAWLAQLTPTTWLTFVVIRFEENQGFAKACNAGLAVAASGNAVSAAACSNNARSRTNSLRSAGAIGPRSTMVCPQGHATSSPWSAPTSSAMSGSSG